MSFDTAINIGLLITLIGGGIYYFGKIILKSRKELTKDSISEILRGITFSIEFIVLPALLIYVIAQLITPLIENRPSLNQTLWIFLSAVLIILQNLVYNKYYLKKINTPGTKTNHGINFLVSIYSLGIGLFFFIRKEWFFLVGSALFDFLIFTFMAARDPDRNEKDNRDGRLLEFNFLDGKKKKYKIRRLGEEFIDLEDENEKIITINKSQIVSIKDLEGKIK